MTDGILSAVESYTGHRPVSCPWRALFDPFVHAVIEAHAFFESGNLAVSLVAPSHRLVQGVGFYHRAVSSTHANQMTQDREQRERERARG
jgi:hypothetical protein